jgi:hypothetical protein
LRSAGLGSKKSAWKGPPFMKRWMTRRARGGKCVGGLAECALDSAARAAARAAEPAPAPSCLTRRRREYGQTELVVWGRAVWVPESGICGASDMAATLWCSWPCGVLFWSTVNVVWERGRKRTGKSESA